MQTQTQPTDDVLSEEESRRRELLALVRRPSYRRIYNELEDVSRSLQLKREVVSADLPSSTILANGNSNSNSNGLANNANSQQVISTAPDPGSAAESPDDRSSDSSGTNSPDFSDQATTATATILPQNLSIRFDGPNGGINFANLTPSAAATLLRLQPSSNAATNNGQALLLPLNNDVFSLKTLSDLQRAAAAQAAITLEAATASVLMQQPAVAAALSQAAATSSNGGAAANCNTVDTPPALNSDAEMQAIGRVNASTTSRGGSGGHVTMVKGVEDVNRKREVRLLKNREAAKECRRKKKEYIKCLENRVNTLEHQNTQLIEELKNLKALYCRKAE